MFNALLGAVLFGALSIFLPGRPDGDELYVLSALMAYALGALFFKPKRDVNILPFVIIWIFAAVTCFFSNCVASYSSVVNLFIAFVGLKAIADRIDLDDVRVLAFFIMGFVVINYLVLGLQADGMEKFYWPAFGELAGMSWRPWILGCGLVLALPFLMEIGPAWGLLVLPGLIIYSYSSACLAAAGLVAIVYFWDKPKIRLAFIVLLPAAIYCFFRFDGIDHNRIQVWGNTFPFIKNIWIGNGIGAWAHSGFVHKGSAGGDFWLWIWAHNEYYQHFFEQGIIGVGILGGFIFFVVKQAKSKLTRSAAAGLLAIAFFHPVLHFGKLSFFALVIVALILAEGGSDEHHHDVASSR